MPDPTVWTVPADGGATIVTRYGFKTDIIGPSYSGFEQRSRLRQISVEALEFSILSDGREAQLARTLLEGAHDEAMAVPMWQYGSRLSGAVGIGDVLLPITDAQQVPYRRSTDNGGYALVWKDPWTWELFSIASTSASGVTTSDTATRPWASGEAYVFPARSARLTNRQTVRRYTSRALAARLTFSVDPV